MRAAGREQRLELRILELDSLYRNACRHRDQLSAELDEQKRLTESARSLVARLWDENVLLEAQLAGDHTPMHTRLRHAVHHIEELEDSIQRHPAKGLWQ